MSLLVLGAVLADHQSRGRICILPHTEPDVIGARDPHGVCSRYSPVPGEHPGGANPRRPVRPPGGPSGTGRLSSRAGASLRLAAGGSVRVAVMLDTGTVPIQNAKVQKPEFKLGPGPRLGPGVTVTLRVSNLNGPGLEAA